MRPDEAPRQEGLTVAISWNISWNCDRKNSCKALDDTDAKGMDCHQRHLLLCMQRNPIIRLNELHGGSNVLIPLPGVRDPPSPVSSALSSAPPVSQCVATCMRCENGNPRTVYETNDNQWHPTAIQNLRLLSANSCHISREAENEAFGKLAPPQCCDPRVAHPRCQAAAGPQRRRWWRISHIPKRRSQKMSWRHLHHQ